MSRKTQHKERKEAWFEEWFDSPYYHILYQDRDETEASHFIENLVDHLGIPKGARVLDLACGKGRHAIQLHSHGFDVTGLDLSPYSISQAKSHEREGLHFDVHDMREVYQAPPFEHIFNLFTSFGYFETEKDDKKVIDAVYRMLEPGGHFVLDFLNMKKVLHELVPEEQKTREGIDFHIERNVEQGILVKRIRFHADGRDHEHEERLQVLFLSDLQRLVEEGGLSIKEVFGSYALAPYVPERSDRTIIIAQKPHNTKPTG